MLLLNAHNSSTLTLWTPSRGIRMYASCVWARLCGGKGGCSQQKARVQECILCTPNWGFHHSSQKKKKKEGKKKRQGSLTSANYMVKLVTLAANNKAAVAMCIAVVGCTAITVPSIHIVAFCSRIREIH